MGRGTHPFQITTEVAALTDAATIAVDMATRDNFTVTLGGSRTLGAPTGLTSGRSGVIVIKQDATGGRTLAFNSIWKFTNGETPILTTAENAVDALVYYVESATRITAKAILNVQSTTAVGSSVRFNYPDASSLTRTPGVSGNRQTWTVSFWMKPTTLIPVASGYSNIFGADNNSSTIFLCQYYYNDHRIYCLDYNGSYLMDVTTSARLRDPSAWYHIVIRYDTTQATAANRFRIYINGIVQPVTSYAGGAPTYRNQNDSGYWNLGGNLHQISGRPAGSPTYFDGYFSDFYNIDGLSLDPSSFGQTDPTTGMWVPKVYNGTYGTNGCYLKFNNNSSAANLGLDSSGNGNTWTVSGISVEAGTANDSLSDYPTNNFCTLNPLQKGAITVSNGALDAVGTQSGYYSSVMSTFGMSTGKWYWEFTATSSADLFTGIATAAFPVGTAGNYVGIDANSWSYYSVNGTKYNNGSYPAYGATWTTNDVIGTALDLDAGTVTFYKNGVSQGVAYSGLTANTYFPAFTCYSTTQSGVTNFGQRSFIYPIPSGHKALCTANLPTPSIVKPNTQFDTVLWTGNGTSQSPTLQFQPDLVWLKSRSATTDHKLTDSVRGVTVALKSNSTEAGTTDTNGLTAFNSNGFSIGSDTNYNNNGATYIGWAWKKGATPGFNIITATKGAGTEAFAHGFGVKPEFAITRFAPNLSNWYCTHKSLGAEMRDYYILLQSTNGVVYQNDCWGTEPDATNFYISTTMLTQGYPFVLYLFTSIPGFSQIGGYTGNGNADGVFVYTGFRPRYVLIKNASSNGYNWHVYDTARNPYNMMDLILAPNDSFADQNGWYTDILSNGFKFRGSSYSVNGSGQSYIYAAFAETPFKYSLAR